MRLPMRAVTSDGSRVKFLLFYFFMRCSSGFAHERRLFPTVDFWGGGEGQLWFVSRTSARSAVLCSLMLHTRGPSDSLSPLEATRVTSWDKGTAASWLACYFRRLPLTRGVNLLNLPHRAALRGGKLAAFLERVWHLPGFRSSETTCTNRRSSVTMCFLKSVNNDPISQKIEC